MGIVQRGGQCVANLLGQVFHQRQNGRHFLRADIQDVVWRADPGAQVRLAGGRVGVMVDDVLMGEGGRREATAADIRRALKLYWTADLLLVALVGAIALALLAI